MKKTLLVAAMLAGFAGVASAQSNLTLYGIIDIGYQYNKAGYKDERVSKVSMESGHQSSSRIGFMGSEDIGGGLKGKFQLEAGFNADTGTSADSGSLFNRKAWVGLEGGFGEVRLGRQEHVTSLLTSEVDPFENGFGEASGSASFDLSTKDPLTGAITKKDSFDFFMPLDKDKANNAIAYVSPNFSGLTVGVNYSTEAFDDEKAGAGNNDRWFGTAVSYKGLNDRLLVTASWDQLRQSNAVNADAKNLNYFGLGATYDFNVVKLHAGFYRSDFDQDNNNTVGSKADKDNYNTWLLGVSAPIGANGLIMASYKTAKQDLTWNGDEERKASAYAIGYTHNFSKRTNFFTTYAHTKIKDELIGTTEDYKSDQFAVGLRHKF